MWTNSFTVAAQQEAIAKEGPLQSEEFCLLLETVVQGEASNRARQFAQRLRDTADEELVAPMETFVVAAHREPDLAEELDRADEAAEAEVDEETPSPAQQRQLLRAHVKPGPPNNWRILSRIAKWSMPSRSCQVDKAFFKCPECDARPMPRTGPTAALLKCYRFKQVCGIDVMEVWNPLDRENPLRISQVICHGTRYHQEARRQDMTAAETFATLRRFLAQAL